MLGRISRLRFIEIIATSWIPCESRRELFVFSYIVYCIESEHQTERKTNSTSTCIWGHLGVNKNLDVEGKCNGFVQRVVQRKCNGQEICQLMQQYKVKNY